MFYVVSKIIVVRAHVNARTLLTATQ